MLTSALIGCGRIAPNHYSSYQNAGNVTLKWACDRDPAVLITFSEEYPTPNTTVSYRDILDDPEVDIVSILSDHAQHYQLAKEALLAGKHVIVEKPFTLDLGQAKELVSIAHEQKRYLICISQHRFDPMVNQVRDMIHQGQIGKPLLVTAQLICGRDSDYYSTSYWHGMKQLDGGSALINQGYHILDIIVSIFGKPEKTHAFADRRYHTDLIETEDTLSAQFRFTDRAIGSLNITSGYVKEDWDPTIEIIGTQGRIKFDLRYPHAAPYIEINGEKQCALPDLNTDSSETVGINYYGNLHQQQINDFVQAIIEKRPPAFQVENAVETLSVIHSIYRSAEANGFVWGHVERKR